MSHRIDLNELLDPYVEAMSDDTRDNFKAALYCWRDEAVTDALRSRALRTPTARCPGCGETKFVGHGPLCGECFGMVPPTRPERCRCGLTDPESPCFDCRFRSTRDGAA